MEMWSSISPTGPFSLGFILFVLALFLATSLDTHRRLRHSTAELLILQAEDGIRDAAVTGVQTCALPISAAQRGDEALCLVPLHRPGRRHFSDHGGHRPAELARLDEGGPRPAARGGAVPAGRCGSSSPHAG